MKKVKEKVELYHPYTGKVLFSHEELKCPETGKVVLDPEFVIQLINFRMALGLPIYPTSCCRSFIYNEEIGGHERSLHVFDKPYHPTKGTAALDIEATEGIYRHKVIKMGTARGWSIGIGLDFLHLDRRVDFGMSPKVYPSWK